MLRWLTNRNAANGTALELYGSSVAQARLPVFYREMCVADTFSGRFELVMLHVGLLLRRLTAEGSEGRDLGRVVVEQMFTALDDDMREIGVGDLSVAKKMQAAASSFYGRLKGYDAALSLPDNEDLVAAVRRNVPAADGKVLHGRELAEYARATAKHLEGQAFAELRTGRLTFPVRGGWKS